MKCTINSEDTNSSNVLIDEQSGTLYFTTDDESLIDKDINVDILCKSEVSGSEVRQEVTIGVRAAHPSE